MQRSPADRTRGTDTPTTTVKDTEAKALMLEIDQKSQRLRSLGLVMLGVICVGVIIAVTLGALVFLRQADDRAAEAKRREQQAEVGNKIISDIYGRLNNVDKNVAELVGKEPLPPLEIPTTTVVPARTTPTTARRTTTTTRATARPTTPTTNAPPTTSAPSSTTTTTAPPSTTTTQPEQETCVGPLCLRSR